MNVIYNSLFYAIGILLVYTAQGQISPTQKQRLDSLLTQQADITSPGMALGIVKNGEIIYEGYIGLSDVSMNLPIDSASRFNYASSGKQFTAILMLSAIENGWVSADEDIRVYLPKFFLQLEDTIRIRHLINHTSGIRDIYSLWGMQGITWWENTLSNEDALTLLKKQTSLNFVPGSRYLYSNSNYILLTAILDKITGKTFSQFSKEWFTDKKLMHTAFESDHNSIPKRVLPYGFWKKYTEYPWLTDLHGDGALFTTLKDQLKWEVMIQNSHDSILNKSQRPMSDVHPEYGYGVEFGDLNGMKYLYHEGSTGAYGAVFMRFPEQDISIVAMTNYSNINVRQVSYKALSIVSDAFQALKTDFPRGPKEIGEFLAPSEVAGTYSISGFVFRFFEEGGRFFLERYGRENVELEHEQGNVYHEIADPDFKQVFTSDSLGSYVTAFYPTHDPYRLTKVTTNWEGYFFTTVAGTYKNNELGVTLNINHTQQDEYSIELNGQVYKGKMFIPDQITYDGTLIIVNRNEMGEISFLHVNRSRALKMRFDKVK